MKKYFTLILLALLPIVATAYDAKINGIYYNFYGDEAEVTRLSTNLSENRNAYSGDVFIPASVTYNGTTYSVTSIGNYAFSDCSGLTSITIPNSMTNIGSDAFYDCSGLTSITIPNSVTSIGDKAFLSCSGLTDVTIGSGVTSIGWEAFYYCSGLTSVHIADVEAWCNIEFDSYMPHYSNPLYYANHLYLNGQEIKDLVIPNSVTRIRTCAFIGCSGLTSVTIPSSVTSIADDAFSGCSNINTLNLDYENVNGSNFSSCGGSLQTLTLGDNVTSIGGFEYYFRSLTSITIPNSVTSISYEAFRNCSGVTSVTIGNGVTSIGNYAFSGCSNISTLNLDYENIGTEFSACRGSLQTLILGDNVASISGEAFKDCSSLTDVTIGNGVSSIGGYAFSGCSGLTSINIPGNGATSIGNYAFKDCSSLTDVTIGNGVSSIGSYVFSGCSSLTSINIPGNGATSIGNYAFYGSSLTNVTIGNGVESIGDYAFENCSSLTDVTIGNGVTSIGNGAFSGCSGLTSVTIPSSVTSIGGGAFNCSNLVKTEFASMEGLCGISFANLYSNPMYYAKQKNLYIDGREVTDVVIPNSAKNISQYAFAYYTNLTSFTVESGNSVYDSRDNCNAIIETATGKLIAGCMNTVIPGTVTGVNDYAFYSCTGLTSLTIPSSVTSIGTNAFRGCKLRNILIKGATPPTSFLNSFSEQSFFHTTLYIPTDSWDAYAYDNAWYKFINIRETATAGEQVSLQQAYTLMDAGTFAYSVYDPVNDCIGSVSSASGIDENNPNHRWQVVQADGRQYLYNMGAKRFAVVSSDGSLSLSTVPDPIEMENGEDGIILGNRTGQQWAFVSNEHLNVEQDVITGIGDTPTALQEGDAVYDLGGRKLSASQKGINIIRYSDGTTRKVIVKQ